MCSCPELSWIRQVPKPKQALTIYQKLQIVNFANDLVKEKRKEAAENNPKRKLKGKDRCYVRGLNLQKVCQEQFGAMLGKIKVCQLQQQAKSQKWHLLSENQQRAMHQLSDACKVNVGLTTSVKGWKALSEKAVHQRIEEQGSLPRWTVPGPVLEELDAAMTEFTTGNSLTCQRRDIVLLRHCAP